MIKYIHIVDSKKKVSPLRAKCMQSIRDKVGSGNEYCIVEVPYSENIFEMIANVDRAKYEIAARFENACIIDTDCFIATPIHELPINSGIPYFAKYDMNGAMQTPDTYYFYVNGCCEWFKNNLPASLANPKQYSLSPSVLKGLSGFEYIPEMSYCHFYDSMRKLDAAVSLEKAVKKLNILRSGIAHLNSLISE